MKCNILRLLGLFLLLAGTAQAECDDVEHRLPFHRTPYSERTVQQKIQTRQFQIECRKAIVQKMRDLENPPQPAWGESCDNAKCKQIFDYCNAANAHPEKFLICSDSQCAVPTSGSHDYCFDVFKPGFGQERTFCYQYLLGDLNRARVDSCWMVKREKYAEESEVRIDRYNAEIQELEFQLVAGSAAADQAAKQASDGSAGKGSIATPQAGPGMQILKKDAPEAR